MRTGSDVGALQLWCESAQCSNRSKHRDDRLATDKTPSLGFKCLAIDVIAESIAYVECLELLSLVHHASPCHAIAMPGVSMSNLKLGLQRMFLKSKLSRNLKNVEKK